MPFPLHIPSWLTGDPKRVYASHAREFLESGRLYGWRYAMMGVLLDDPPRLVKTVLASADASLEPTIEDWHRAFRLVEQRHGKVRSRVSWRRIKRYLQGRRR